MTRVNSCLSQDLGTRLLCFLKIFHYKQAATAVHDADPDGDPLTITKNSAALPAGVTYDAANKRFVYDGVGPLGFTSGNVVTADDGKP